jgi:hypothetical protein
MGDPCGIGPEVVAKALAALGPSASIIGRLVAERPGRVRVLDDDGTDIDIARRGWDHFT